MRTSEQRIARYNIRMAAPLIDPVRAAVNAAQLANFAIYELEFYPYQVAMRDTLASLGVPIIDYAAYEAFNGECYHLYKTMAGGALANELVILIAKWSDAAHLGATAIPYLTVIASDVWHFYTAPVTP